MHIFLVSISFWAALKIPSLESMNCVLVKDSRLILGDKLDSSAGLVTSGGTCLVDLAHLKVDLAHLKVF